jgi:lipopolysaccharide transport system ATP-binding protein
VIEREETKHEATTAAPEEARPAVVLERLGKRYGRGGAPVPLPFFGDRLYRHTPRGEVEDDDDDEFDEEEEEPAEPEVHTEGWALRGLSISVPRGVAFGVVGPSGCGKSTLMKVLGRITPPTEGRVLIGGRVAPDPAFASSLLRPDKTVSGNYLLLMEFLGIPKREARERKGEVFAFGDLDRIATRKLKAVPRAVEERLVLSTIVNLGAQVLLLEGKPPRADAEFTDRFLASLRDHVARGATLIVSSDRPSLVRELCTQAVWLDEGAVQEIGDANRVIDAFEEALMSSDGGPSSLGVGPAKLDPNGSGPPKVGDEVELRARLRLDVVDPDQRVVGIVKLHCEGHGHWRFESPLPIERTGEVELRAWVDTTHLPAGKYRAGLFAQAVAQDGRVQPRAAASSKLSFRLHPPEAGRIDHDPTGHSPTVRWDCQPVDHAEK